MIRRVALSLGLAAGAIAGLSCGRDPTGPQPGVLQVRLAIPFPNSGADGAILFTLAGPAAPTAAIAAPGLQVFHGGLAPVTKYAIVGTLSNNATILTLQVTDVRQQYSATVTQVAASTYQLRALSGYAVTVVR